MFDNFPKEFQKLSVLSILDKPQNVVNHYFPYTKPPKPKRVILLGHDKVTGKIGCLLINTKPSRNDKHVALNSQNREYLDYDSHVDCTELFELNYEDLLKAMLENTSKQIGEVSEDDFQKIKIAINSYGLIKQELLEKYNLSITR